MSRNVTSPLKIARRNVGLAKRLVKFATGARNAITPGHSRRNVGLCVLASVRFISGRITGRALRRWFRELAPGPPAVSRLHYWLHGIHTQWRRDTETGSDATNTRENPPAHTYERPGNGKSLDLERCHPGTAVRAAWIIWRFFFHRKMYSPDCEAGAPTLFAFYFFPAPTPENWNAGS